MRQRSCCIEKTLLQGVSLSWFFCLRSMPWKVVNSDWFIHLWSSCQNGLTIQAHSKSLTMGTAGYWLWSTYPRLGTWAAISRRQRQCTSFVDRATKTWPVNDLSFWLLCEYTWTQTLDFCLNVCSKTRLRLWRLFIFNCLTIGRNHEVSHISDIVP